MRTLITMRYMRATLVVVGAMVLLFSNVQPAFACSADEEFTPVVKSVVIVGGRISGWTRLPQSACAPGFTPIHVRMEVNNVFKGDVGAQLQFDDVASLYPARGDSGVREEWAGGYGACGAFDADPPGQYAIIGLLRQADGDLQSNRLLIFFLGPEPRGQAYQNALDRVGQPLRVALPDTGELGERVWVKLGLLVISVMLMAIGGNIARQFRVG